jgi:ribosomal protein S18 acetylase RimI-like enzyme
MMFRTLTLRLRNANQRRLTLGLLVAQALIFVLDTGTGAAISYSPFYCLTVALAAWRLPPAAITFFIASATLARVYDYTRLHHDSALLLAYDIGQSATVYAVVAWLAWEGRAAFSRLAQRCGRLQHMARHERHRRALDATIRRALPADVPAIVRLTVASNDNGAFDPTINDAARQAAVAGVFERMIADGVGPRNFWQGGQGTVPTDFWVSERDGQLAGYMMVMGLDEQHGPARELHSLVIDPAWRDHGLGSLMIDFFCDRHQHRPLLVACRYRSKIMYMLERRHFKFLRTVNDYHLMERR